MRLGVLDVGSNTVHLLVVDAHRGARPLPAYSHKADLRLADHLDGADRLTAEVANARRSSTPLSSATRSASSTKSRSSASPSAVRRSAPSGSENATSKTFKQLARIGGAAPTAEGPLQRRVLACTDLTEWAEKLAPMPSAERAGLPGVSDRRAQQLLAGAIVADAAMDLFGLGELEVCPWALREGVILRRLDMITV
jgi:exopolyphosphatase/pppGpp-phosphohydrolase